MDIQKLIGSGESITKEFKTCKNKLPKNLFETICAFLNRAGGDLLLGVADDGTVTGVDREVVPQLKKEISSLCNNGNKISPTVYLHTDEIQHDGKTILHLYVPESSQVHRSAGRIFDRNEDGDFDITDSTDLVAQMYIRKQREFTENTIYPYAATSDLDVDTINRARIMAVNRQPHHPWESLTNDELLKSAGLYKRDLQTGKSGFTLACILLFGKDETILSALPYYKTDAICRRENLDRYDDRDEIKCNLIRSYDRLMSFLEKHLNDKFYMEGEQRIDVRNTLFREVVANLLIHREFSNAFPAKLIIGTDEVTTENGNKARSYGAVDPNHFDPYPKNPVIAGVFKEIGWAEELGSGMRNIKKYSAIYSGKPPLFEDGDIFRVVIALPREAARTQPVPPDRQKDPVAGQVAGKSEKVEGKVEGNPKTVEGKPEKVEGKMEGNKKKVEGKSESSGKKVAGKMEGSEKKVEGKVEDKPKTVEGKPEKVEGKSESSGKKVEGKAEGKLSETQLKILAVMKKAPSVTASALAQECGLSEGGIRKNIARLKALGKLERTGSDKKGSWIVKN